MIFDVDIDKKKTKNGLYHHSTDIVAYCNYLRMLLRSIEGIFILKEIDIGRVDNVFVSETKEADKFHL